MGAFYSPQGNLAIGVLETRTCLCRGPDMFGNRPWNLAWGPDMSGPRDLTRDKTERPNKSGLGDGHDRDNSLEPG
jgi:hypothetical protein